MVEAALKPFAFLSLPVSVVRRAQEYDVLARDVGRTAGRCKHLLLHGVLDLASYRHHEILPLRARPRLALIVQVFLAVNPLSKGFKPPMQSHSNSLRSCEQLRQMPGP